MPKKSKPAKHKKSHVSVFLLPFTLIGKLVFAIINLIINAYNNFVYALIWILGLIGRIALFPLKIIFSLVLGILETIGQITLFFVVLVVKLPSLPFLFIYDLFLYLKDPDLVKFKLVKTWEGVEAVFEHVADVVGSTKRFFVNINASLSHSPDVGIQFVYAFVRTPVRFAATSSFFVFMAFAFYIFVFKDLPSPDKLKKPPSASTKIYARDCSTLLYKIYRNENRSLLTLNEVPMIVRQATIAIEDKDFYRHHGYSLSGILRAAKNNFGSSNVQGGSTITQQLIKNTMLSPERTFERKIKELVLSLEAEVIFSKDQILQMYLNEVAYGGPAYGVEEASQMYFGKSVQDIDLAEASFLAGLPAAPSKYSPYIVGMTQAKERQAEVLKQMVRSGYINIDEARLAYKAELRILPPTIAIRAPHFVMYVKNMLEKQYGVQKVEEEGMTVCTSLDPVIQAFAEKAVTEEVNKIKIPYRVSNGAALVTNPKTGEILAMVGSVDYWDKTHDGNVNLTTAERQPGSSIKVVNYAYALSHGYTPSSVLQDTPVAYKNAWETYAPVNYDGKFRGNVTLRSALAMSLNIPAVKVLNSYGPDKMVTMGQKMGITTWNNLKNYGLSITLGAAEVKMTDMAVVFGVFANSGKRINLKPFRQVYTVDGQLLEDINAKNGFALARVAQAADGEGEQVVPELVAYQMTDILSDNAARTPEFGPRSSLYIPQAKVAAKTGTTNDFRDNWTFGYTPNFLVGAWVGNNDNSPMSGIASGITGAAPIWNRIMTNLIDSYGAESFATPSGLVPVKICATNGLLTCPRCPTEKVEYFLPGSEPKKTCSFSSPEECQARKTQMESEGKPAEEIVKALSNCPLAAPSAHP